MLFYSTIECLCRLHDPKGQEGVVVVVLLRGGCGHYCIDTAG